MKNISQTTLFAIFLFFVFSGNYLYAQDSDSTHMRLSAWNFPMQYEFRNVPESVGYITTFPLEKIKEEIGEENFSKMNLEFWIHTSVNNAELSMVDRLDISSLLLRNMIDSPLEAGFIGDNGWQTLKETGSVLFTRNNILVFLSPQPLNKPDDLKIIEQSARLIDSLLIQSAKVQNNSEIPVPVESNFEIMSELPENIDDNVKLKIEADDPNHQKIYIREFADGLAIIREPGETFSAFLRKSFITEDSTGIKVMLWIWNDDRYFTLVTHEIPFKTINNINTDLPELQTIKIYPNPTNETFTIETQNPEITFGKLYNSTGVFIKTLPIEQGINTYHIAELKSGVYFIQIPQKESVVVKKLVKN